MRISSTKNCFWRGVALKDGWWGKRLMIIEDSDSNQLWLADPHDQG